MLTAPTNPHLSGRLRPQTHLSRRQQSASPLRDGESTEELLQICPTVEPPPHYLPRAGSPPHLIPNRYQSNRYELATTAVIPIEPVAQAGILGAGPRVEELAQGGETREIETLGADAGNVIPSHGTLVTAIEGRTRRRPSGWDVQDSSQTRTLDTYPSRIGEHQHINTGVGGIKGIIEVGHGEPHHRNRGKNMGRVVHPFAASPRRSPARSNSGTTTEYNQWSLRPVSPAWSTDSIDSRYGAFSPPQMVSEYYMTPNAHSGFANQGIQGEGRGEVQSETNVDEDKSDGKQVGQQDVAKGTMELDGEAMAPASKAPRAP